MRKISLSILGLVLAFSLVGCTTYYKVTDPTTHKDYFTNEVKQQDGATKLRDGKTGSNVTIQNSEIKTITKEEYETGRVH